MWCVSFRVQVESALALGVCHVLLRIAAERCPATCLESWWAADPLQLDALLDAAGVQRCYLRFVKATVCVVAEAGRW